MVTSLSCGVGALLLGLAFQFTIQQAGYLGAGAGLVAFGNAIVVVLYAGTHALADTREQGQAQGPVQQVYPELREI